MTSDVISRTDGRTGRVAAIYARVSSERQRQDETIQSQTVGCVRLAAAPSESGVAPRPTLESLRRPRQLRDRSHGRRLARRDARSGWGSRSCPVIESDRPAPELSGGCPKSSRARMSRGPASHGSRARPSPGNCAVLSGSQAMIAEHAATHRSPKTRPVAGSCIASSRRRSCATCSPATSGTAARSATSPVADRARRAHPDGQDGVGPLDRVGDAAQPRLPRTGRLTDQDRRSARRTDPYHPRAR